MIIFRILTALLVWRGLLAVLLVNGVVLMVNEVLLLVNGHHVLLLLLLSAAAAVAAAAAAAAAATAVSKIPLSYRASAVRAAAGESLRIRASGGRLGAGK